VLRYQGAAIPLVDLRKRLGSPAPLREDTRTVILEFEGAKIGVIVDAVTEVLQVRRRRDAAAGHREGIGGGVHRRARGAERPDDRRLNTNKLLNSKEKLALQGVT